MTKIHSTSFKTRRRKVITVHGWTILYAIIALVIIGAVMAVI